MHLDHKSDMHWVLSCCFSDTTISLLVWNQSLDLLWNSQQKQVNAFQVQQRIQDLTPVEYRCSCADGPNIKQWQYFNLKSQERVMLSPWSCTVSHTSLSLIFSTVQCSTLSKLLLFIFRLFACGHFSGGRSHWVSRDGWLSDIVLLWYGNSKYSVIGPILFIQYMVEMYDIVAYSLDCYSYFRGYADFEPLNTAVFKHFELFIQMATSIGVARIFSGVHFYFPFYRWESELYPILRRHRRSPIFITCLQCSQCRPL